MIAMRLPPILLGLLSVAGCAMFGGDDGVEEPTPLTDFEPLARVQTVWTRKVGGGGEGEFLKLSPAIYENRAFAATPKGRVRSYQADTGEPLWSTSTKIEITGGTGAGDGIVVVGTSNGDVLALSADAGEVSWRAKVSSEVLAPPQVADGVVVVRTIDGKVFGLDATSGSRLWNYDRTVPALTLRGTSAPVLRDGVAICGFDGGLLVALALQSGQPIWEANITLPRGRSELERMVDIDSSPVIADNTVYVATYQGRVAAVDLGSGEVLWRREMSSYAGVGVDPRSLYVTDDASEIWALDRNNGASLWNQANLRARGATSPVGFSSYVVVGDSFGYVHWLSREDGKFVARVKIDSEGIRAPPVQWNDTLYVYSSGGTLAALRVEPKSP